MSISYGDWQPGHRRLGAPELFVLRNGPDVPVTKVFKLALLELVGRGILSLGVLQQGSGHTTTRTAVLLPGTTPPADLGRPLRSVMDAYDGVPAQTPVDGGTGVALPELARALRERHGGKLSQWVADEVVTTLVDHGLYTEEQGHLLGVVSTTRYAPTREGKAAQAELEASIKRAVDQFPTWAADERARAAAFLAVAGPAVLLMPELQPEIDRLHAASPQAKKMMAAGVETVASIADHGFDIFRLAPAGDELRTLDLNIDYGRLDRDSASAGE